MEANKIVKAILAIVIIVAVVGGLLVLSNILNDGGDYEFSIGILQLVEHRSLDAARQGFIDKLEELGIEANIDIQNAQGDIPNTNLIANRFVSEDVDLILAIATPSAQATRQATRDRRTPVVFTAVTDPFRAEIIDSEDDPDRNITGVRDNVVDKVVEHLFGVVQELRSEHGAIGIIYNIGERNSQIQVEQAEAIAEEMGITIQAVGITSVNDIPNAISSLAGRIDGLYIITDNMVASAITMVANLTQERGILTVSVVTSDVQSGIMYAKGINYYELGRQTALMAKRILIDRVCPSEIQVEHGETFSRYIHPETIEALNLDRTNPVFADAEVVD